MDKEIKRILRTFKKELFNNADALLDFATYNKTIDKVKNELGLSEEQAVAAVTEEWDFERAKSYWEDK